MSLSPRMRPLSRLREPAPTVVGTADWAVLLLVPGRLTVWPRVEYGYLQRWMGLQRLYQERAPTHFLGEWLQLVALNMSETATARPC